jgi:acylphosphatase
MSDNKPVRLHAIIKGRVQGVGFRAFVVDKANQLDLKGWVRNHWDGSVEVTAEGERPILDQLLLSLRQGPRSSNVTQMAVDWEEATGEYLAFYSRSTV